MRYSSSSGRVPTDKVIREAIARFEKEGRSGMHSIDGMILSHILNHCTEKQIPFVLRSAPGGYQVEQACDVCIRPLNQRGDANSLNCGGTCQRCIDSYHPEGDGLKPMPGDRVYIVRVRRTTKNSSFDTKDHIKSALDGYGGLYMPEDPRFWVFDEYSVKEYKEPIKSRPLLVP